MQRIKGLLFDKDGTLFDFHATWGDWTHGLIDTLSDRGADAAKLSRALGYDQGNRAFDPESPVIAGTPDEALDAIDAALPGEDRAAMRDYVLDSAANAPLAEAAPLAPLLDRFLAAGLILGVATNDGEDVAHAHLNAAGITDKFAFIAGYDSGFGPKPEPGMQNGFLQQTGLTGDQVAMVGDSLHDLIAGRRAGMATIAVLTGVADKTTLAPHADVVLPDISGIPAWLGI